MGGVQQRTNQVWLTIERNQRENQVQLFDFSKERIVYNSNQICFPSYLHYYQQSKTVTYSLLEDRRNVMAVLDCPENCQQELCFTKTKKHFKDKIWKLIKDGEEVQLKKGLFIKLGRIQLQVKELRFLFSKQSIKSLTGGEFQKEKNKTIVLPPTFSSSNYMKNSDLMSRYARMKDSDVSQVPSQFMKKSNFSNQSNNQQACRFCFDSSSEISNPLFNVCLCSGSVKNIHFQCLRSWVKNKMGRVESSHCIYYHYEPLVCELCKKVIDNEITYDGRIYPLFEPEKMHPPYVRLQHTEDGRVFEILIRLEEQAKIEIGRGSQNELNLNDPSISRSHCSLYYTSHRLILKGKKSKYGTFIELLKTTQFESAEPLQLLIHNNLVTIQRKSSQQGFFSQQCCNNDNTYRLIVK